MSVKKPVQQFVIPFLCLLSVVFPCASVWAASNVTINATVPAICGNTVREGAEACDDGNLVSGDGCSNVCAVEGGQNNNNNDGSGNNAAALLPVVPPPPVVPPVVPVPDPIPVPVVPVVPVPEVPVPVGPPIPQPQPEVPAPNGDQPAVPNNDNDAQPGDQDGGDARPGVDAGDNNGGAPQGNNNGNNNANGGDNGNVNPNGGGNGDVNGGGNGVPDGAPADGENGGAVLPAIFDGASFLVPSGEHIARTAIHFFIANGSIPFETNAGVVTTLQSDELVLAIQEYNLSSRSVNVLTVTLGGETRNFVWDEQTRRYVAHIKVPGVGQFDGIVGILYADGAADSQTFSVIGKPLGVIREMNSRGNLEGAMVTLLDEKSGGVVWDGGKYFQSNPSISRAQGVYGFVVPNGTYKVRVEKEGYHTRETVSFDVHNFLVNSEIQLVKKVIPVDTAKQKNTSVGQNVKNVAFLVAGKTKEYVEVTSVFIQDGITQINKVANNPEVEKVTEQVVAPAITTVAVATVVPSLWSILFPLLRFLFLQPILLFGKKRRREWGMVYNSLNKLPIDLAVVRLVDKTTKRVKQSRVTDLQGRFLFMTEPGNYAIEVAKPGFVFPSHTLAGVKSDGNMVDIYHGEVIGVTQKGAVITPNIPVDPAGEQKTPQRIIHEKRVLWVQNAVSLSGLFLTAVSVYVSPLWYMWVFLGIHIAMFFTFQIFVKPKKPKGWGIVYEEGSKKPVGSVIIRLFTKEYNKLVSTQTSDSAGRYAFLVGPSEYYITVEKNGYESFKSEDIKIPEAEAKASLLKKDVGLKKK